MAILIELKPGVRAPVVRLALVISSSHPPPEGINVIDEGSNRTFYANASEQDIAVVTKRAMVWADERTIPAVYLRRDA